MLANLSWNCMFSPLPELTLWQVIKIQELTPLPTLPFSWAELCMRAWQECFNMLVGLLNIMEMSFYNVSDYTFILCYFKYDCCCHRSGAWVILKRILKKGEGPAYWDGSDWWLYRKLSIQSIHWNASETNISGKSINHFLWNSPFRLPPPPPP